MVCPIVAVLHFYRKLVALQLQAYILSNDCNFSPLETALSKCATGFNNRVVLIHIYSTWSDSHVIKEHNTLKEENICLFTHEALDRGSKGMIKFH